MKEKASIEDLVRIERIINYQYGHNLGTKLLEIGSGDIYLVKSATGRLRYMYFRDYLIAVFRASDFSVLFTIRGAQVLKELVAFPHLRVVVENKVSKFIAEGRNVFAKHVIIVDLDLRAGDEVIVVNQRDDLLAVGKLVLSPFEIFSFRRGIAVKVRRGVGVDEVSEDSR
ncbi:MAG: pseudouridine synthase [Thermoprotei archaeon]|nr:MAG: pseudouridine synthase [Thermoprotei archaeon]